MDQEVEAATEGGLQGWLRHLSYRSCSRGHLQGNRAAVLAAKVGRWSRRESGLVQKMPWAASNTAVAAVEVHRGKWAAGRAVVSGIAVETAVADKVRAMGE